MERRPRFRFYAAAGVIFNGLNFHNPADCGVDACGRKNGPLKAHKACAGFVDGLWMAKALPPHRFSSFPQVPHPLRTTTNF